VPILSTLNTVPHSFATADSCSVNVALRIADQTTFRECSIAIVEAMQHGKLAVLRQLENCSATVQLSLNYAGHVTAIQSRAVQGARAVPQQVSHGEIATSAAISSVESMEHDCLAIRKLEHAIKGRAVEVTAFVQNHASIRKLAIGSAQRVQHRLNTRRVDLEYNPTG